jgi:hypothetical protein
MLVTPKPLSTRSGSKVGKNLKDITMGNQQETRYISLKIG